MFEKIKIAEIVLDNPDVEVDDTLVNSIRELGLLCPIGYRRVARADGSEVKVIVFGRKRVAAYRRLGLTEIEAIDLTEDVADEPTGLSDDEVRELEAIDAKLMENAENAHRRHLDLIALGRLINEWEELRQRKVHLLASKPVEGRIDDRMSSIRSRGRHQKGLGAKGFAGAHGINPRTAQRAAKLAKLREQLLPECLTLIDAAELGSNREFLETLAHVKHEDQKAAVEAALEYHSERKKKNKQLRGGGNGEPPKLKHGRRQPAEKDSEPNEPSSTPSNATATSADIDIQQATPLPVPPKASPADQPEPAIDRSNLAAGEVDEAAELLVRALGDDLATFVGLLDRIVAAGNVDELAAALGARLPFLGTKAA